jgi:hypothetical protein
MNSILLVPRTSELHGDERYVEQASAIKPDFVVAFGSGYAEEPPPSLPLGGEGPAPSKPVERNKLVIDAYDASTDAQVWHATAESDVSPQGIDDMQLQADIHRLLAPFPVRSAAASTQ